MLPKIANGADCSKKPGHPCYSELGRLFVMDEWTNVTSSFKFLFPTFIVKIKVTGDMETKTREVHGVRLGAGGNFT